MTTNTHEELIHEKSNETGQQNVEGNTDNVEEELDDIIPDAETVTYDISGDNNIINDGTNIGEQTNTVIGGDQNNYNLLNPFKNPRDTKFSCPYCDEELNVKKYGKHTCKNCRRTFIVKNREQDKDIILYKTLQPDEAKKYDKILAHINNKLKDKDYSAAYQHCKKAEELAPGEVTTWENFALTEFLLEITKEAKVRRPTEAIMRTVTAHIEKCKEHGMTEEEYEPLAVDIANRLFNIERARMNSIQAQNRDQSNNPKWSKRNFIYLIGFLRSFEICYALYPDALFLEGYVNELKKEYKWILKNANGELITNPACAPFNAVKKLEIIVAKIQNKKPDYCAPDIAEERFFIRNVFLLKINGITTKTDS